MKATHPKNLALAVFSVGACAATAVLAQVGGGGPDPVCLHTVFLRFSCDNLAKESSPECNDVILQDDAVLDAQNAWGCGSKSRITKTAKCIRAVYVYDPEVGSCTYSHVHTTNFNSNEATGDPCGAC